MKFPYDRLLFIDLINSHLFYFQSTGIEIWIDELPVLGPQNYLDRHAHDALLLLIDNPKISYTSCSSFTTLYRICTQMV